MKRLLTFIFVILLINGCGILKNRKKTKEITVIEEVTGVTDSATQRVDTLAIRSAFMPEDFYRLRLAYLNREKSKNRAWTRSRTIPNSKKSIKTEVTKKNNHNDDTRVIVRVIEDDKIIYSKEYE